ncbi:MAG: serine hydrolase [Clostridia bacterium]|nr:serine hydrolase [Clostridia bacterium]
MEKLLFKEKRIVFCAIAFAMALLALLVSCENTVENTDISEDTFTNTESAYTTSSPIESAEVTECVTTFETTTEEIVTAAVTTEEVTTAEITTAEVTTVEVTEAPAPETRDISEFAEYPTDTPEYRLYDLLSFRVPEVEKTKTEILEDGSKVTASETVQGVVSLYYKDLVSGEVLVWNGEQIYSAASMIKAVYCYTLLMAADNGEVDLDEEIVYESEMYVEGTGKFKEVESGTPFTVHDLISYTLRYSDNTAYSMLRSRFATTYFASVMKEQGITPASYSRWWKGSVYQYGDFFSKLYEYLTSDSENGKWISEEMQASLQVVMLKNALYPDRVAHKYGWDADAYCDGAVALHSTRPYVVVFMSNLTEGHIKQANTDFIYEIGDLIREIHHAKYEVAE